MIIFYPLIGFVLGLSLGSLALALAERSLENKSFFGRSACPNCKHQLSWADLVPVFSYLALRGKCRYCHKKIKLEYLLVEVLMGIAVSLIFFTSLGSAPIPEAFFEQVNFYFDLVLKVFIATILMIIAITDLKETLIPDRITYPAIISVLIVLSGITAYRIWYLFQSLNNDEFGRFLIYKNDYFFRHAILTASPLWGGIATGLVVGLSFLLLIVITRGRGMGGGDLKLGLLLGLYFGFPLIFSSIILAFFLGSIFAIGLIIAGRKKFGQSIPFGPFLSLGAFITILYGKQIMEWYLNLRLI